LNWKLSWASVLYPWPMEWKRLSRRPFPVMVWTPAQAGTFFDAVADDRLYALWHLFCFRGLRRGEACGLRWADTDLAGGR
jgi:integrase